jgi:hypothetical protein
MMHTIKECLHLGLTPEQYMAWKLVEINSTGERAHAQDYINKFGEPSDEVITALVDKGMVYAPFKTYAPYSYSEVTCKKIQRSVLLEMAEEFWNTYPATFPLSTGGMFVARTGSKDIWTIRYMEKIEWSDEKHKEVMHQLNRYIRAVSAGKINGCKLVDWIEGEMWNTMKDIPETEISVSAFKEDI